MRAGTVMETPPTSQRPARKTRRAIGFPEGWLMLVGAVALIYGITVGRLYQHGERLPTVVWLHVPLAFGLVLGVVGGVIFRRTRDLAALGAAMFAAVWTFAYELSSYGGTIPASDQGGIGLVIIALFVAMIVPMFVGAHAGAWIRRQYRRPRDD